jgi:hypothetical protein
MRANPCGWFKLLFFSKLLFFLISSGCQNTKISIAFKRGNLVLSTTKIELGKKSRFFRFSAELNPV